MDWPMALYDGECFGVVLDWMKLFASVGNVVLGWDASNCLIASIGFHNCSKDSIELGDDGS